MREEERRAFLRLGLPFKGSVTFENQGQEFQKEVRARNLSATGGYFFCDTCPTPGDQVKLCLEWRPEGEQEEITLTITGAVLRVNQLEDQAKGFAVQFDRKD